MRVNPFDDINDRLEKIEAAQQMLLKHMVATPAPSNPQILRTLTRDQVKELLHISDPTVSAWNRAGILKPYYVGGRTLYKESEVLAAIDKGGVK